jgi:hypothetical protein
MISGNIEALSMFKILRSVATRKMSGTLSLTCNEIVKRFVFFQGDIRLSYSSIPPEHLAVRLRDLGLVSTIELQGLAKRPAYKSEQIVDEVLSDGLVADRRLARIEGALTRERLLQVFEWTSGTFEFQDASFVSKLPAFDLDITALLIEAAFIRTPFAVCERFILSLQGHQLLKRVGSASTEVEQSIRDTWVFRQSVAGITLQAVLSDHESRHINVRSAAAMILSGVGILQAPETPTEPSSSKAVASEPRATKVPESVVISSRSIDKSGSSEARSSIKDGGRRVVLKASTEASAKRPRAIPKARPRVTSESSAEVKPKSGSAGTISSAKKGPCQRDEVLSELDNAQIAALTGLPENERARLVAARKLVVAAPELNHYQILGVSKEATPPSVRETFRRMAREFHADRFSRYNLPDSVHQLIQLTFVTINASNEVLGDPERRAEYDLELSLTTKSRTSRGRATRSAPQELNRALSAERELTATLSCLCRGEVTAAKSRLIKARGFGLEGPLEGVLDVYIKYLLELEGGGRGLAAIQARALDALGAFIADNDSFAEVFLFLGRIYKRTKDEKRALAAFKKSVSLAPNLAEASSELRYLQRQAESQNKGLRGLLRT